MERELVLLVDDDPVFVEAVAAVLRTRFDVATAADGEQAMMRIAERRPDVIVLDVMMSYQSEGYDLASTLKKSEATGDIPIVILSGVDTMFEIRSRMEKTWVEVECFMTKPADFERLFATLRSLIDARRRRA